MPRSKFSLSLTLGIFLVVSGCDQAANKPVGAAEERRGQLMKEKDSIEFELSLREKELKDMEASTKRPGVVGVSPEWLRRHDDLKEKVTELKVKLHDIESELNSNASPPK